MKNFKPGLITLIVIALISCDIHAQNQTREVRSFRGIRMNISGDLYLTQGNNQKVVLEGPSEVLDRIETEVNGGVLIIRQEDNWKWWKNWRGDRKIKVYVTAPHIEELAVSGSGSIESENRIRGDEMELSVSGSGNMHLDLDIQELDSRVSGSGSMDLRGSTRDMEVAISGSGNVDAEDMSSENCEVRISGSGNCRVQVSQSLSSRVSGSGSVFYRGNPEKVNSSTSGSGRIRKVG